MKVKFTHLKRKSGGSTRHGKSQIKDNQSTATGGQPTLNQAISLTSLQGNNQTFLPIDSILYPKESTHKTLDQDKNAKRRRGIG